METEPISTIEQVKELVSEKKYKEREALISAAMFEFPHDAVPHNLMGLMLESMDSHPEAMKHFRAAYALDPTYRPSSWNLERYGGFTAPHPCAYFERDCELRSDGNRRREKGNVHHHRRMRQSRGNSCKSGTEQGSNPSICS